MVGGGRVAEVVGGHHHGVPGGALGGDGVEDVLAGDEVEAGDRLVEEQHLGLLGQALGHERSLSLAAGELPEGTVGQVGDGERLHGGVDGVVVVAAQPAQQSGRGVAPHRHGLAHGDGEVLVGLGGLQHVGDARRVGAARARRCDPTVA